MTTCEETLLTVRDVARRFQASRQTIIRWVASGDLQCFRVGNIIRFSPEQVEQFIEANEKARSA